MRWLIAHSPAYEGVTISQENLDAIVDGQLDIPTMTVGDLESVLGSDVGPAPAQTSSGSDVEWTESACVSGADAPTDGLANIQRSLSAMVEGPLANAALPRFRQNHSNKLVNWREERYFFAKAWPTLFMPCTETEEDGSIYQDIPAELNRRRTRDCDIGVVEWIKYLMTAVCHLCLLVIMVYHVRIVIVCFAQADYRYSRHSSLKFALKFIKDSRSTFGVTFVKAITLVHTSQQHRVVQCMDGLNVQVV